MTKPHSEILSQLRTLKNRTLAVSASNPMDAPWESLLSLINSYIAITEDHWPLTAEEKQSCKLGWFSVKNIEEAFPDLHELIIDVDFNLKQ